jgi:LuxR family maltose regulon positive regulatory protein
VTIAGGKSERVRAPRVPGADVGFGVLATKLQPPWQRTGIIERPNLLARLHASQAPVVALIAPAGYGKSTTAAQFAVAAGPRVAWLSADARDCDAATLLRGIAGAIARVEPLRTDVIAQVASPGPSVWTGAVPKLGSALADLTDVTLVIDDVDRIADGDAIDVVLALVEYLRGNARLILTGRTHGSVPVARMAARGLLAPFSREDLALGLLEIEAVLAATGQRPSATHIQAVSDRTEGWAAGVYLTAMTTGDDRILPWLSNAAPDRLIEDYLSTEVLGAMHPDDAERLRRWSVLDQFHGDLCDAVLDRTGSGADLDRLERTNLFVIPLDRERTWFRLHHLLGDYLRAEVARTDPHGAAELRRRAAAWFESKGMAEIALEYAIAAEDVDHAARLTLIVSQPTMNAGRTETVRRWFSWLEAREAGIDRPRLAAAAAMNFALDGDTDRAERWSDIAAQAERIEDPDDPDTGLMAISRACLMRGTLAEFVADAELAERTVPDEDPWRVAALLSLGVARMLQGELDAAEASFAMAIERWDRGSFANTAASMALGHAAVLALGRGDRVTAEAHARKARGILQANGLTEQAAAVSIDALDARLAMTHHAVDQARRDIAHAQRIRSSANHSVPWLAVRARLDLVRAHIALGDGGGARTLMSEIREIVAMRPNLGSLLDEVREVAERVADLRGGVAGASTLTIAELRLLPLLTTHLTFREIGERLFISQNTVKTQAISIYRKLDSASRSEAIERAVAIGLLESSGIPETFIPPG